MAEYKTPWESPKVKLILELFNGHVASIKQMNDSVRRDTNAEEIPR